MIDRCPTCGQMAEIFTAERDGGTGGFMPAKDSAKDREIERLRAEIELRKNGVEEVLRNTQGMLDHKTAVASELMEENKKLRAEVATLTEALDMIEVLAVGYDGFGADAEGLRSLIDDMAKIASTKKALSSGEPGGGK